MNCSNGKTRNMKMVKYLNKDVKDINIFLLVFFTLLFLICVGFLSYKVNFSYAFFSYKVESDKYISAKVCSNLVNKPKLSSNMIPVYYDSNSNDWRKADATRTNWYDYCNQKWANAVTVTEVNGTRMDLVNADVGSVIPMDRINTMLVWIPRYSYTIWNYNSSGTVKTSPQEIKIYFEKGTTSSGEVECVDDIQGTSDGTGTGTPATASEICKLKSTGAVCTDDLCNGKKYTHPAFTFGEDELTGFWIGKFELSSDVECSASEDEFGSGCNLDTIRPLIKPNLVSWRGAMIAVYENNMMAMNDDKNNYGFSSVDDTHMIRNMEWGAVSYLSHSGYGVNREVLLNSNEDYITGCGPQEQNSSAIGPLCNTYDSSLGQLASTTGNIYRVYDMSGSTADYVMGNMISPGGVKMMSGYFSNGYSNSGYSGILYDNGNFSEYNGYFSYPDDKYYDKYSYGAVAASRSRSKLGDAIKEVGESSWGWYSNSSVLVYKSSPWQRRSLYFNNRAVDGVFNAYPDDGGSNSGYSSRLVVS